MDLLDEAEAVESRSGRRIAILEAEDAVKWANMGERIWRDVLEEDGDVWEVFQCHRGQFPDPDTASRLYDLMILTGSHYSANDDISWIHEAARLLPLYVKQGVRIVGSCFGHQLLARALGGAVSTNPSGRFVLGFEEVQLHRDALESCGLAAPLDALLQVDSSRVQETAAQQVCPGTSLATSFKHLQVQPANASSEVAPMLRHDIDAAATATTSDSASAQENKPVVNPSRPNLAGATGTLVEGSNAAGSSGSPCRLRLLESHGDQVTALPKGALMLASSDTAQCEMWAYGRNVLAFQFHPELTPQMAYEKIWPALSQNGRLSAAEAAAAELSLNSSPNDTPTFLSLLRYFAKHGLADAASSSRMTSRRRSSTGGGGGGRSTGGGGGGSGGGSGSEGGRATPAVAQPPLDSVWSSGTAADGADGGGDTCGGGGTIQAAAAGGMVQSSSPKPATGVGVVAEGDYVSSRGLHEDALEGAAEELVGHVRGALDAGLRASLVEYRQLHDMNHTAAAQYSDMADVAAAVAHYGTSLSEQQAPVQRAIGQLGALEAQVDALLAVVEGLDEGSKALAKDVGLGWDARGSLTALWATAGGPSFRR